MKACHGISFCVDRVIGAVGKSRYADAVWGRSQRTIRGGGVSSEVGSAFAEDMVSVEAKTGRVCRVGRVNGFHVVVQ